MGHFELNTSNIKLCLGAADVSAAYLGNEKVYPTIDEQDYFSITNDDADNGCFFVFDSYNSNYYLDLDLEYSYDKKTWTKWPTSEDDRLWLSGENLNPAMKTAYIRGNNTTISPNDSDYISLFQSGTSWHAGGNIMSLLRKNNFDTLTSVPDYCFYRFFINQRWMTAAPKLPATTVGAYAYQDMFNGCITLTAAPALPATTIGTSCYAYMFYGCKRMTSAPAILPATTLADDCYRNMFNGCEALTAAPALPATTLASGCYRNMFTVCSSLTTAPELPARQLVSYCYHEMFKMCSSMNYIKALFTSTPGTNTTDWVAAVATSGTFVKNAAATWTNTGENAVPVGWTIETASS